MDRALAAFDIETIPDPDAGRRLWSLEGTDEAVIEAMLARRLADTEGRTDFLPPPLHRVVAIAIAWLEPASGMFKLSCLGTPASLERELIEALFAVIDRRAPRLVSWNGTGFDVPVLRYRSMLHGVAAPAFYRTDGEFKWNNYQGRYHDLHVDLMDCLSGYGASNRVALDDLARLLGLPGKTLTRGHRVHGHVLHGEIDLVRTYCEIDALHTLLLYLMWAHHRGRLSPSQLHRHRDTIARELTAEGRPPAWREVGEALAAWPPWPVPEASPAG